jgi:hypothetical protein
MSYRLTYATMFNPPESMHADFEAALAQVRAGLGATHGLHLAGADVLRGERQRLVSPIDTRLLLGEFSLATPDDVAQAMAAARAAFPAWRARPAAERPRCCAAWPMGWPRACTAGRRAGAGGRQEPHGGAGRGAGDRGPSAGTADDFERATTATTARCPTTRWTACSRNRTVLRPYGVWAGDRALQLPAGADGGPTARRWSPATRSSLQGPRHAVGRAAAGRLPARRRRAGGRASSGCTGGHELGRALADPDVAGITFTGSVRRRACCCASSGRAPRAPASPRWAARTPPSSPPRRPGRAPPPASCARPSGCRGRSARPARGCTSSARWRTALRERLRAQTRPSRSATPPRGSTGWARSSTPPRAPLCDARASCATAPRARRRPPAARRRTGARPLRRPTCWPSAADHRLWREELFLPLLMLQSREVDRSTRPCAGQRQRRTA